MADSGSTRFAGHLTVHIYKMSEVYPSREFQMLNYRAKIGGLRSVKHGLKSKVWCL